MCKRVSARTYIVLLIALFACLFLTGCQSQDSFLLNIQADATASPLAEQTPSASGEPAVEATEDIVVDIPEITGSSYALDDMGIPILDEDTHFERYYLELSSIRFYEYGGSTFLDAVYTNTYVKDLAGEARICFYGEDGKMYAYGNIETAEGGLLLHASSSAYVYAEILTEVSVLNLEYRIEVTKPFMPIEGE